LRIMWFKAARIRCINSHELACRFLVTHACQRSWHSQYQHTPLYTNCSQHNTEERQLAYPSPDKIREPMGRDAVPVRRPCVTDRPDIAHVRFRRIRAAAQPHKVAFLGWRRSSNRCTIWRWRSGRVPEIEGIAFKDT
jgi:hypothetical protein